MDLIGQRFGKWIVIGQGCKDRYWLCRCGCGKEKEVFEGTLKNGRSVSCGCETGRFRDLSGERFGKVTVISRVFEHDKKTSCAHWLCECECGKRWTVAMNALTSGKIYSCGCQRSKKGKEHHGNWKGGKTKHNAGYVYILKHDHPNANKKGYVLEHVLIMSDILGRPILKGEHIHHKNGIRDDNRPENLELWTTCHPRGQRVEDQYAWAKEIIAKYERYIERR